MKAYNQQLDYHKTQQIADKMYWNISKWIHNRRAQQTIMRIIPTKYFREVKQLKEFCLNQNRVCSQLYQCGANIVRCLDLFVTSQHMYMVFQCCNGGNLGKVIKEGKLSEKKVIGYLKQIFDIFRIFNKNTVIHGNLKPQNILLHNQSIKLGDIRFFKFPSMTKQLKQILISQSLYMAPQVIKGQIPTSKSDIWSIGVIFYQLLYGKFPYQSIPYNMGRFQMENLVFPVNYNYNYSGGGGGSSKILEEFIGRCLNKDSNCRIGWQEIFEIYHITQDCCLINKKQIISPILGSGNIRSSLRETTGTTPRPHQPQPQFQPYNPNYRNTINFSLNSPQLNIMSPRVNFQKQMINTTMNNTANTTTTTNNNNNTTNSKNSNNNINRISQKKQESINKISTSKSSSKMQARSRLNYQLGERQVMREQERNKIDYYENKNGGNGKEYYNCTKKQQNNSKQYTTNKQSTNNKQYPIIKQNETPQPQSQLPEPSTTLFTNRLQNTRLDLIIKNHSKLSTINSMVTSLYKRNHRYSEYLGYLVLSSMEREIRGFMGKVQQGRSVTGYVEMRGILAEECQRVQEMVKWNREMVENGQEYRGEGDKFKENIKDYYLKYVEGLPDDITDVRAASQIIDYLLQGILIKKDAYQRMSKQHLLKQMKKKIQKYCN